MPLSSNLALLTAPVAALVVTFVLISLFVRNRRLVSVKNGMLLPPGPSARWFWGSTVPAKNISPTFNVWTDQYGPVITLRQANNISVVITRVDAATELMEKEGGAIADRPPNIAAAEILSGNKRMLFTGAGERLRRFRKTVHTHLQPRAVVSYEPIQLEQAKELILGLLDDPENHERLTHRYSTSIVLRVAYGRSTPTSIDDQAYVGVAQVLDHFNEAMRPGAYLVDRFPWLKHVPGYGRRLKEYHDSDSEFFAEQLRRVKREMSSGDAGPSFSRALLENEQEHQFSFDEMAYLAGALYEAGSDSTANGLTGMLMAAACFPDTQLRVQEELDKVVGMDRLPTWSDWDSLPQLHAFIFERLRWRPPSALGIAHRSTRDIVWRGYCIPAGTTVSGNHWAISRDPAYFPDPENFDPQRWFDKDGKLRTDLNCYAFGFGRRVCPGMYFANRSLFIGLALLLWSFRVCEIPDAPIDTTPITDTPISHCLPFVVKLEPRMGSEARLREMMTT